MQNCSRLRNGFIKALLTLIKDCFITNKVCDESPNNPFCLEPKPTDPYNWIFWDSKWNYAQDFQVGYTQPQSGTLYRIANNFFYCQASCAGIPGDSSGVGYEPVGGSLLYTYGSTCPAPVGLTNYAPIPNPKTGACERTQLNDPCVNPCVRQANGTLSVNSNSGSCRVFPNVTSGGNQSYLNNSCPTVCPSACVELWQSCPPGTGPLTTLAQTKSSVDLLSLTGPYRQDGEINPLWPTNYSSTRNPIKTPNAQSGAQPIFGKPYTECYAYNTEFCDLPMAWQKTVESVLGTKTTQCFSSCPAGTFPDSLDPSICNFLPDNRIIKSNEITSNDKLQTVFCNPQYFNPVYFADQGGIQKGCQSRGLPAKQGSSCIQGTSPYVNEFFNLEWCMPDCPTGYFFDLSQSTCVASCQGTIQEVYNPYLDYVDLYSTTNRCEEGKDCLQNNTPGRCPSKSTSPTNSRLVTLRNSVNSTTSDTKLSDCPVGMEGGNPARNEQANLCYDVCQDGYEPVSFCNNNQPSCSNENLIFSCRAQCPRHSEGLGPWSEKNNNPIFSCTYNYPGNIAPTDPNLWVPCPDDGRFYTLQTLPLSDTSISTLVRTEPLCIRKSYLRRTTCPIGFTLTNNECLSSCNSNDALVTDSNGITTCQSSLNHSTRHSFDLQALVDGSNAKKKFQGHVLLRKAFSRGLGSDPNQGLSDPSSTTIPTWLWIAAGVAAAFVLWFFIRITSFFKSLGS